MATQPDAGADRIHAGIARVHRQLGAKSRFTRHSHNFHCAIGNFRHLVFEKGDDKLGIRAGENNLRTVIGVFHGLDKAAQAFAYLIFLDRHALTVGQQRLKFAEVNFYVRSFKTPDHAAHDFAGAILEFIPNHRLFSAAHLLQERLFGVLRGDATKSGGSDLFLNFITELRIFLDLQCVKSRDFVVLRFNSIHHDQLGKSLDFAGFWVCLAA